MVVTFHSAWRSRDRTWPIVTKAPAHHFEIKTINILFTLFVRFLALLVSFSHIYDVYIAKSKSSHQIYPFNTIPTLSEAFWVVIFAFWALFWWVSVIYMMSILLNQSFTFNFCFLAFFSLFNSSTTLPEVVFAENFAFWDPFWWVYNICVAKTLV